MLLFFIQYLHYSGMWKAQASCLTIWTIKTSSNLPPLSALRIILSEFCLSIKRQPLALDYVIHSVMEKPPLAVAVFGKHTFQRLRCPGYTQPSSWVY